MRQTSHRKNQRTGPAPIWLRSKSDVALRNWPGYLHAIAEGDLSQTIVIGVASADGLRQFIEVAEHRRRDVEVELPTRSGAYPKAVFGPVGM